ncbi:MAG: ubiquinol-cytochrome C chaperone family protein [Bauldia sp.]
MLGGLFQKRRLGGGNPAALYGAIVAQARAPGFYAVLGVPDTIEGRFEMVILHMLLVLRRLRGTSSSAEASGQQAFDLFCEDMDRSLREMGVGDLSVPKRMRKIGESFYGRAAAYEPGLLAGDAAELAPAIARNVWPDGGRTDGADPLAYYAVAASRALQAEEPDKLAVGRFALPDPAAFAAAETSP